MRRTKAVAVAVLIVLAAPLGAVAGDPSCVAKVNGVGIAQEEFDRSWKAFLQHKGMAPGQGQDQGEQVKAMRKVVLDGLIGQELLWQEAKDKKVKADDQTVSAELDKVRGQFASPEEFAGMLKENGLTEEGLKLFMVRQLTIQNLVNQQIAKGLAPTEQEVHDFYASNADSFKTPERVHARHILVKVDANADQAARDAARKKIDGLRQQLLGGADFAELARNNSDCPSKERGGDLGMMTRGQTVKPFEDAAFALEPGKISEVVETQFGYHVIRVEERQAASTATEKEMTEKIKGFLKNQKTNQAVMEHVKVLREKAKVEILMPL
ncbi:MAG: peptidylprolyl isomerase [bacterium]